MCSPPRARANPPPTSPGRARTGTFNDCGVIEGRPETAFRRIAFEARPDFADRGLRRTIHRFPFVPHDPQRLDQDCFEAFNIQVQGLARRLDATGVKRAVIGVSGGLDSTHALLVACRAFDLLGRPRSDILAMVGEERVGVRRHLA
jgi:NAD+ synthase (glutamine-hydrolysing)